MVPLQLHTQEVDYLNKIENKILEKFKKVTTVCIQKLFPSAK